MRWKRRLQPRNKKNSRRPPLTGRPFLSSLRPARGKGCLFASPRASGQGRRGGGCALCPAAAARQGHSPESEISRLRPSFSVDLPRGGGRTRRSSGGGNGSFCCAAQSAPRTRRDLTGFANSAPGINPKRAPHTEGKYLRQRGKRNYDLFQGLRRDRQPRLQ